MKDEIKDLIKDSNTFDEVNEILSDWMNYYNRIHSLKFKLSLTKGTHSKC